jgi:thiamine-phosphate pyrophosphorylase
MRQISPTGRDARLAAAAIRSRMLACNCEIWVHFFDWFSMSWTYTGNDKLARAATRLYQQRISPCKIAPLVFMSDPQRVPDVVAVARTLPKGATLIYRHFGDKDKVETAKMLRRIASVRSLQLLIGQDVELAEQIGVAGVHLPERELSRGAYLREHYPNWLITGAAHSFEAIRICADNKLDAAILSPVFTSDSKSAGDPIGVSALADIIGQAHIPVIALGGITPETSMELYESGAAGIAGVSMFLGASHD